MISPGWVNVVKRDFLRGVHRPEHVYKLALYTGSARLNAMTEYYETKGEVEAKGYTAGGRELEGYMCDLEGSVACLGWTRPCVWPQATIEAHGGLIYNASQDNRAMLVIQFNEPIRSTNGKFLVPMPDVTPSSAPFRIV